MTPLEPSVLPYVAYIPGDVHDRRGIRPCALIGLSRVHLRYGRLSLAVVRRPII